MSKMMITKAGLDLLAKQNTGTRTYWIGYYGLAYVDQTGESSGDAITPDMTRLTKTGDYIYNIWQGDLTNTGFAADDTSGARSLFGLTMYDKNICSNYRYVLDGDGNNNLVAWSSAAESSNLRSSLHIYRGVHTGADDVTVASEMPVPAPLFYCDDPFGGRYPLNYDNADLTEEKFDQLLNTSWTGVGSRSDYPHGADSVLPLVSDEARFYAGEPCDPESIDDFGGKVDCNDPSSWMGAMDNREFDPVGHICQKYAQYRSISNYNLQHGNVSSEGYRIGSAAASHNMSKATRLFPISSYTVLMDGAGAGGKPETSGNISQKAGSIKFGISLSPIAVDRTYLDTVDTLTDAAIDDPDGLFSTKRNSFKFNRVGIYAVEMDVHRFADNGGATGTCSADHVQFEIINDREPVLFAVADINETIVSDDGEGTNRIDLEFVLNLAGHEDSAVINDTGIFYNLYERSAVTWYQNQLLASAGLCEAVTSLGIDVANVRTALAKMESPEGCSVQAQPAGGTDNGKYAKVNHTHNFMKNLVDGFSNPGSVRGIDTVKDGFTVEGVGTYHIGDYSMVLGKDTRGSGKYSLVQGINSDAIGDMSISVGEDNALRGTHSTALGADRVSTDEYSTHNAAMGMPGAGINFTDGSRGNLAFGMAIPGAPFNQYGVESSSSNMLFGNLPKDSMDGINRQAVDTNRSIIGFGSTEMVACGVVKGNSDSLLMGLTGVAAGMKSSIMMGGSRGYGETKNAVVVGDSRLHSVEHAEITATIGGETYTVAGITASALSDESSMYPTKTDSYVYVDYGTSGNYLFLGDGDIYGNINGGLFTGKGNTVGEWSLRLNRFAGKTTDPGAQLLYGLPWQRWGAGDRANVVVGDSNHLGLHETHTVLVGDNGYTLGYSGVAVLGNWHNEPNMLNVKTYMGVDAFVLGSEDSEFDAVRAALVYTDGETSAAWVGSGGQYTFKPGVNVVVRQPVGSNPAWRVYNRKAEYCSDSNITDPDEIKWTYDRWAIQGSVQCSLSSSLFIGNNVTAGSESNHSVIVGNGIDAKYLTLQDSVYFGSNFVYNAPENYSAAYGSIRKTWTNVKVMGSDSLTAGAMARMAYGNYDEYSNSMIFLGHLVQTVTDPDVWSGRANTLSCILGTYGSDVQSYRNYPKPEAAMIYTGGISLIGKDIGSTYGLLKIGSKFADQSYIVASSTDIISSYPNWSTDGWKDGFTGQKRDDIYDVLLVPGTTQCPYAGRTLVVDHEQERDGTLHIKLGGYAGGGSSWTTDQDGKAFKCTDSTGVATSCIESGKVYYTTSAYIGARQRLE